MKSNKLFYLFFLCVAIQANALLGMEKWSEEEIEQKERQWKLVLAIISSRYPWDPITEEAVEQLLKFIDQGMPINSTDLVLNPLFAAIEGENYTLAGFLLEKKGADPTLILQPTNKSLFDYFQNRLDKQLENQRMKQSLIKSTLRKIHFLQNAIKKYKGKLHEK